LLFVFDIIILVEITFSKLGVYMSFLSCKPSVFVIEDRFEILINTLHKGISCIEVNGKLYYEENSGVLSTEKNYCKISVPQTELNIARKYTIIFRELINRKAYFSELKNEEKIEFEFKPLGKTTDINIYHVADVHYRFDLAKKTADYFGDKIDMFVVNGDIGEVETEQNYLEVCKFVGDISQGKIPVLFVRGNHDTRGKLAELYTEYFPCVGKNTYFWFSIGCLNGIALDCGEDKPDNHAEYGGVNVFELYRRKETEFLRKLKLSDDKLTFAVSHVCPAQNTREKGCIFDIDDQVYREWNDELKRLNVSFMLCGHIHEAYVLEKNSNKSLRPHDYPVIVGSAFFGDEDIWGAALTVRNESLDIKFTDRKKEIKENYLLNLKNKSFENK
jgi:Icc-related predicted phosphoesterase